MKIKLEIPFYSQKEIVTNGEADGSCGIVCVKMILDFCNEEENDIHNLLREGHIVGGKTEAGWIHEAIVRVLRNHGATAYKQEFVSHEVDLINGKGTENLEKTKEFFEFGLEKIKHSIDNGLPVIASVKPLFGENESAHMILIIGYDEENLIINDPQRLTSEENPLIVSVDKFKEFWKGFVIFVGF